jgi:hypothetical protein
MIGRDMRGKDAAAAALIDTPTTEYSALVEDVQVCTADALPVI